MKDKPSPRKRGALNPAPLRFENLKEGMWITVLGDRESDDEQDEVRSPFSGPDAPEIKSLFTINGLIPGMGGLNPHRQGSDEGIEDGAPLRVFSINLPYVVCGVFRPSNVFADKPLILDLRETEVVEVPTSYVRGIMRLYRSRGTPVFKTRKKKPNLQSRPSSPLPSLPPSENPSVNSFLQSLQPPSPPKLSSPNDQTGT